MSDRSLPEALDIVASDAEISPPLYFVLAWISAQLGAAPELVRLPALLGGLAVIPLTYLVGARAVGRAAGLIGATVMALSPFMVFYATDGRGYSLMIALLLGSTYALLRAAEDGQGRWWVTYAVCSCLAMYTHYTSAFVLAAQLAWLLWAHPAARRSALVANLAAAALFVPWLPWLLADLSSPTTEILEALQGDGFKAKRLAVENWAWGQPYLLPHEMPGQLARFLAFGGIAIGALAGLARWWRAARPRVAPGVVLVLALALAAPAAELVLLLLGTDLFGARNLNASWGGFALAVGALLAGAGGWAAIGCAAAVLAAYGIAAARTLDADTRRLAFDGAAGYVDAAATDTDVVVDAVSGTATPVPLTSLDVHLSDTTSDYTLFLPEGPPPFLPYKSPVPDPRGLLDEAIADAAGERLFVVAAADSFDPGDRDHPAMIDLVPDLAGFAAPARGGEARRSVPFELPPSVRLVARERFDGWRDLEALVFAVAQDRGRAADQPTTAG